MARVIKLIIITSTILITPTIQANLISNQDEKGEDQGNLEISTNTLKYQDIKDKEKSKTTGYSAGAGSNKVDIGGSYASKDKQQTSKATIGKGKIKINNEKDKKTLAQLNRDLTKSQEITKDWETERIDIKTSIDTRVLTKEGRAQIAEDFKQSWQGIKNLSQKAKEVINDIAKLLEKDPAEITTSEIIKTKGKVYQTITENKDLSKEEKQAAKKILDEIFNDNQIHQDIENLIKQGLNPQEAQEQVIKTKLTTLQAKGSTACLGVCATAIIVTARIGYTVFKVARNVYKARKFAKAINKLFKGKTPKATELKKFAEKQGWKRIQSPKGPLKYIDKNGIKRITIKKGSSRTKGSEHPHVEIQDASGQRINPVNGKPVSKRSSGNHIPIDFDL